MKRLLFFQLILLFVISCVNDPKIESINPFEEFKQDGQTIIDVKETIGSTLENFHLVNLKPSITQKLLQENKDTISLILPSSNGNLDVFLEKTKILSDDFKISLASKKIASVDNEKIYYNGYLKKNKKSIVSLAITSNEISGSISSKGRNLNFGKINSSTLGHIFYDVEQIQDSIFFDCQTEEDSLSYRLHQLQYSNDEDGDDDLENNCIRLYVEVDNDVFINQRDASNTFDFVTNILSQVISLYNNESVTIEISEIFIWDTPDSYSSSISSGLIDFVETRSTFNGNLAHLLSFRNSNPRNTSNAGGKANGIGGLCIINNNFLSPHAHTSLFPDFELFPVFSRQVKVIAHEIGHNLGSKHTHACVWNGNNTAIDGCAGSTKGSCALPDNPSLGGTIMSYCDRTSVGIDFDLGFGEQPGSVIRSSIANMICQSSCEDNVEDCLSFNPSQLKIKKDGDKYLLSDGRSRMMLFKNQESANNALKIIKNYNLNQQCFTTRPSPGLKYLLTNNNIPQGNISGEDCIKISAPNNLRIRENSSNSFSVIDTGSNNIPFTAKSRNEAEQIISIIQKYNAQYTCYVSRPNPGMMYLRK